MLESTADAHASANLPYGQLITRILLYYSIDLSAYPILEVSTYDSKTFASMRYVLLDKKWCKKSSAKSQTNIHKVSKSLFNPILLMMKEIKELKDQLKEIEEGMRLLQELITRLLQLDKETSTDIGKDGTKRSALHTELHHIRSALNNDVFIKKMGQLKKANEGAGLEKNQIDEIVPVGGSTRISKVHHLLKDNIVNRISKVQQLLKDYFDGKEPNKGVNPDEVVAYGPAIQDGIFNGEDGDETKDIDIHLLDVTSLTLGIETVGGVMTKFIP
ncbi:hypothetical protein FXO37_19043 [Capsicum annuum]|nr:hypothetical protein FXO37_19043 [Capsicum annuum]